MKQRKSWRMSCDVGKATEGLENKLWRRWSDGKGWRMSRAHSPTFTVTSRTSQLILQPFRRFTYVTAHSPTLPFLHLRHNLFSNPSVASPTSQLILQPFVVLPTSQALHLIHLASRPCESVARKFIRENQNLQVSILFHSFVICLIMSND